MFLIIAIIYIFFILLWYLINSWKLLSENPQPPPPWKNQLPPKNSRSASPSFLPTLKIFEPPPPPCRKGVGRTLWRGIIKLHYKSFYKLTFKHWTKTSLSKKFDLYYLLFSCFIISSIEFERGVCTGCLFWQKKIFWVQQINCRGRYLDGFGKIILPLDFYDWH